MDRWYSPSAVVACLMFMAALSLHWTVGTVAPAYTVTPTHTLTLTATSSPTPTLTPTETPVLLQHRVTHYDADWDGGPLGCGTDVFGYYDHTDPTTAAAVDWPCGTRLRVCGEGCQVVIVKDRCGGCWLDLSTAAWQAIGEVDYATVDEVPADPPAAVRGGSVLPLAATTVVWGGCASDGTCHWYNFYWAPTHEAVMQNGEAQVKVQHELCHAHQHWTIDGGAPLDPSNFDLHTWYDTAEGQSFSAAVDGLFWPWSHSAVNGLEDFAWTCADWYLDPAHLLRVSPERYAWAATNLP